MNVKRPNGLVLILFLALAWAFFMPDSEGYEPQGFVAQQQEITVVVATEHVVKVTATQLPTQTMVPTPSPAPTATPKVADEKQEKSQTEEATPAGEISPFWDGVISILAIPLVLVLIGLLFVGAMALNNR